MIQITIARKHLYVFGALLVALAAAVPVASWAGDRFTDVPDSNTFHDDIAWLADAGVTRGCNPPGNTRFCPDDNVTRGQMAAFQRRFAQYLGAEDGVVSQADNADTLDGIDSSGFVTQAELAAKQVVEPAAGGYVFGNGSRSPSAVTIGSTWTVTRSSTGDYTISLPGAAPGCANDPLILVTSQSTARTANAAWLSIACGSGDTSFSVRIRDTNGSATDSAFQFVIYTSAGGQQPLAIDATECVNDEGEKVCS